MAVRILRGDCRAVLGGILSNSIHCVVTSPPYWGLRNYNVEGQIGLELDPNTYVAQIVEVFREVRRVLRPDGTCWVNMGDSYAGGGRGGDPNNKSTLEGSTETQERSRGFERTTKSRRRDDAEIPRNDVRIPGLRPKQLIGMPWRIAFALQEDGWWLRQDIIWSKSNPMPESVRDRCTKAHEYLFLLTKGERYFFDQQAIMEEASASTHARVSQDVEAQIGSARANGGTRAGRPMKASVRTPPPQGWHSSENFHGDDPARDRQAAALKRMGGGNKRHKGQEAYESGSIEHRTKVGLTEYSRKMAEAGSGVKNNTSMDSALAVMPLKRNKRSVWEISTEGFSEAHFATFPTALVEPCILAGTSAMGVCAACGAPYRRDTTVGYVNPGNRTTNGQRSKDRKHAKHGSAGYAKHLQRTVETNGWVKTCTCETADRVPSLVLDPFGGAGTTALVADRLQRDCILIELNDEYADMAKRRLVKGFPLLTEVT